MAQQISPQERIHELSDISSEVASMLKAAGEAINSLTGRPNQIQLEDQDNMVDDTTTTLDGQKREFESNVTAYYNTLQAICARLRRQVYALEEADIISSESAALYNARSANGNEQARVTNGGLGNLDVGWLNSRGNRVGAEKEQEIVHEMKELLQDHIDKGD